MMQRRREKGFTLVELMVSLAVAGILLGIIYAIFIAQRRGHVVQEQVAEMQQNARIATDELTRAIQAIGNKVVQNATPSQAQLHLCGPYELLFDSDLDGTTNNAVTSGTAIASLFTYSPAQTYTAPATFVDAETYRLALVANGSRHFNLVKTRFFGAQNETNVIAQHLVRNDVNGNAAPLFLYWVDEGSGVYLWGDTNGNGRLDAAEAAAVGPVSVTGRNLDDIIRRIQIQVTTETKDPDRGYALNSGYRQSVVVSNVTPRNLWACPIITGPGDQSFIVTNIQSTTSTLSFPVTYLGGPESGRRVNFTLSGPGVGASVFYNASFNTGSDGLAQAQIQWPACGGFFSLFNANAGANLVYDLTATIGQPPSLTTPFGVCAPQSIAIRITVSPGAPAVVTLVPPLWAGSPPGLTTCGGTADLAYQVQDSCGIPLPWNNAQFFAQDLSNRNLGAVSSNVAGAYPYLATVTYTAPAEGASWPSPASTRVGNNVPVNVWAASGGLTSTATQLLLASRPSQIVNLSNTLAAAANTDCPSADVNGTFQLQDCRQYVVVGPQNIATDPPDRYEVFPTINPLATSGPQTPNSQGTLAPSPITAIDASHLLSFTYTPPTCTLGPGVSLRPTLKLDLQKNSVSTNTATQAFPLASCDNCALAADPATMSKCWSSTTLTVARCGVAWRGQPVQFTVRAVSGSGNGSFNATTSNVTSLTTAFVADPSSATGAIANATLYLGTARDGTELEVTAASTTLNASGQPIWSCSRRIPVTSRCTEMKLYTFDRNGAKQYVGNGAGEVSCLARISQLYFEVEDCQSSTSSLVRGNEAIKIYSIAEDGLTVDMEEVDLQADNPPPGQSAPQMLRSVSGLPVQEFLGTPGTDDVLTYPPGKNVTIVAGYRDPNDSADDHRPNYTAPVSMPVTLSAGDRCQQAITLAAPLPVCFPNAITSGGGGDWDGNFKVHWGDVVIRGNAGPGSNPKSIQKIKTAALDGSLYSGSGNSDRFFDIYVGKYADGTAGLISGGGAGVLQPFLANGFGNYFQQISNNQINSMIQIFDYTTMKNLAKTRGVYWYTLASGNIRNPSTGQETSFHTALSLTGPGTRNLYHDGQYIFVDAVGTADPGPSYTTATIQARADTGLSNLPSFILDRIYTEGIIYVAGSVLMKGPGGANVTATTPPDEDSKYAYVTGVTIPPISESDLPIRPLSTALQHDVTLSAINLNGGLYTIGTVDLQGNPTVFGAITAERGYAGNGTGELWYNYNLNVGDVNQSLCIACCTLEMSPTSATLTEGATTQLQANYGLGTLTWASLDTSVADVSQTGLVTAKSLPSNVNSATTAIKVVDRNNCVAWASITVTKPCAQFAVTPATATAVAGQPLSFTASGFAAGSAITWSWPTFLPMTSVSTSPTSSILTVFPSDQGGPGTITATDTNGICTATPTATVSSVCPSLAVSFDRNPIQTGGATAQATLVPVLDPVPAAFAPSWASTNVSSASINSTTGLITSGSTAGTTNITATLTPGCRYTSTLNVDAAGTCNLALNQTTASIVRGNPGGSVALTASNNLGAVSWTKDSTAVNLSATSGTATTVTAATSAAATVHVTATDAGIAGCARTATISVTVPDCSSFSVTPASQTVTKGNPGGTVTLTANNAVGTVTWAITSGNSVKLNATTGNSITVTAIDNGNNKATTIRATDSNLCTATATVTTSN